MRTVGYITLERRDGEYLIAHDGRPRSRDEAIEEIAVCGAENGGEWVLAAIVIEDDE